MLNPNPKALLAIFIILLALQIQASADVEPKEMEQGKKDFDYFCYQCHGYAGDAKTLASRFLDPPPRDFTTTDPRILTRELMLAAVSDGRPSTGMKSFSRVLSPDRLEAVVDYIRLQFMSGKPYDGRYHTKANGWPEHESKYSLAYPFATGELATDTPTDELSDNNIIGLELFRTSCVSCHDRGKVRNEGLIWRARSASWPRRHYDHRTGPWDAVTSATPYQRHDVAPDVSSASKSVQSGQLVFLENCAFCHGADGTGKNWIGSFMEPPAADLTGSRVATYSEAQLRNVILSGIPGSSMPAWRNLLDENQQDQLLSYLSSSVVGTGSSADSKNLQSRETPQPVVHAPTWTRQ